MVRWGLGDGWVSASNSGPPTVWGSMAPVRTCLGCRPRADKSSLVRVVAREGVVIPDQSGILPGRGAWVHPTAECVTKSISRNAFGRALRISGALDSSALTGAVLAKRGLTETVLNEMAD